MPLKGSKLDRKSTGPSGIPNRGQAPSAYDFLNQMLPGTVSGFDGFLKHNGNRA